MYVPACQSWPLEALTSSGAVHAAFSEAEGGFTCESDNTSCEKDSMCEKWGAPFVHKSHYTEGQKSGAGRA